MPSSSVETFFEIVIAVEDKDVAEIGRDMILRATGIPLIIEVREVAK